MAHTSHHNRINPSGGHSAKFTYFSFDAAPTGFMYGENVDGGTSDVKPLVSPVDGTIDVLTVTHQDAAALDATFRIIINGATVYVWTVVGAKTAWDAPATPIPISVGDRIGVFGAGGTMRQHYVQLHYSGTTPTAGTSGQTVALP